MNLQEAEDLAARTLAAIPTYQDRRTPSTLDADRERVASDLAGLREALHSVRECTCDEFACRLSCPSFVPKHAYRFFDNLRLTARLYGVTP